MKGVSASATPHPHQRIGSQGYMSTSRHDFSGTVVSNYVTSDKIADLGFVFITVVMCDISTFDQPNLL